MGRAEEHGVVERAQRGDQDALAILWREINPPLVRYLTGRAGWGGEDIAAQTWLDVARSLHRFSGDEQALRRFVFTVGRRRLVDELRRRARRPEQLMGDVGDVPCDDAALGTVDELGEVLLLVNRLPPDQADAVLLRVVADLDVAQVAEIMDKSPAAVRLLTHRGLRRLERWVESGATPVGRLTMYREQ